MANFNIKELQETLNHVHDELMHIHVQSTISYSELLKKNFLDKPFYGPLLEATQKTNEKKGQLTFNKITSHVGIISESSVTHAPETKPKLS